MNPWMKFLLDMLPQHDDAAESRSAPQQPTPGSPTQLKNFLLSRRTDWVGAAFHFPNHEGLAQGMNPGYYRVTRNRPDGRWDMDWLGTDMPEGEPVYVWTPNTTDFKAIPASVFSWTPFKIAAVVEVIWTILAFAAMGTVDGGVVIFWLMFSAIICGYPFWIWFYNIEPVRGTKVGAAIVAATAARTAQLKAEAKEMHREQAAQTNQFFQTGWTTPTPPSQPQWAAPPGPRQSWTDCLVCQGSGRCKWCGGFGHASGGGTCSYCHGGGRCKHCGGTGKG